MASTHTVALLLSGIGLLLVTGVPCTSPNVIIRQHGGVPGNAVQDAKLSLTSDRIREWLFRHSDAAAVAPRRSHRESPSSDLWRSRHRQKQVSVAAKEIGSAYADLLGDVFFSPAPPAPPRATRWRREAILDLPPVSSQESGKQDSDSERLPPMFSPEAYQLARRSRRSRRSSGPTAGSPLTLALSWGPGAARRRRDSVADDESQTLPPMSPMTPEELEDFYSLFVYPSTTTTKTPNTKVKTTTAMPDYDENRASPEEVKRFEEELQREIEALDSSQAPIRGPATDAKESRTEDMPQAKPQSGDPSSQSADRASADVKSGPPPQPASAAQPTPEPPTTTTTRVTLQPLTQRPAPSDGGDIQSGGSLLVPATQTSTTISNLPSIEDARTLAQGSGQEDSDSYTLPPMTAEELEEYHSIFGYPSTPTTKKPKTKKPRKFRMRRPITVMPIFNDDEPRTSPEELKEVEESVQRETAASDPKQAPTQGQAQGLATDAKESTESSPETALFSLLRTASLGDADTERGVTERFNSSVNNQMLVGRTPTLRNTSSSGGVVASYSYPALLCWFYGVIQCAPICNAQHLQSTPWVQAQVKQDPSSPDHHGASGQEPMLKVASVPSQPPQRDLTAPASTAYPFPLRYTQHLPAPASLPYLQQPQYLPYPHYQYQYQYPYQYSYQCSYEYPPFHPAYRYAQPGLYYPQSADADTQAQANTPPVRAAGSSSVPYRHVPVMPTWPNHGQTLAPPHYWLQMFPPLHLSGDIGSPEA